MAIPASFLDELRARTTLSALIGRRVKLVKDGRGHKGLCPFHSEKTPSFTVSDDKGFYHCFGCGAHGDAIRWLTDAGGMAFMDAVRELASAAGLEVPARSAEEARREAQAETGGEILAKAAAWYARQLERAPKALQQLADRGVDAAAIAKFGLGYAPARVSVSGCGVTPERLGEVGLMRESGGRDAGLWHDFFRARLMIPVHDARGRPIGFGARGEAGVDPKYLNSPDSPTFAKGQVLFNLHRAAAPARASRRLVVVEGFFDVIALDAAGIAEAVAPMGTALTDAQLERAWRVNECPVLLFDGDDAGRKAAMRACERALPFVGPGKSLAVALLPEGEDPDSLVHAAATIEEGRDAIEGAIGAAEPLSAWLWRATLDAADKETPEGRVALWWRLAGLAGRIRDEETRALYLADWRARFDAQFPPPPLGLTFEDMLPDGRVAETPPLGEAERGRLASRSAAWFERTHLGAAEDAGGDAASDAGRAALKRAGRWAWELGRRNAAGLVTDELADAARKVLADAHRRANPDAKECPFDRSFEAGRGRGFDPARELLAMRCAAFERTDMGNAERFNARYGEDFLYTTAKGWLGWDGRRYRVLNQEKDVTPAEVLAAVFDTVRAIQDEAHFVRDTGRPLGEPISAELLAAMGEDPRKPGGMDRLVATGKKPEPLSAKLAAWGRTSESSGRIGCIANLAKRWLTVELSEFDTDAMLLNCHNGTLRFVRATEDKAAHVVLQPHSRADRLTKLTACDYDPDAPAPEFQKLVRWAQPDKARRRYLRQWLGYNLTGDMGEQIFQIWYGPTAANGKSTVGNACREAAGDYGAIAKPETFLEMGVKKGGGAATPDLVDLPGARFVTSGEPPKDANIDEALINTVTGGDPMKARDNFRSFFTFLPIFKWTLWCNELPPIPRGTEGIWRRVKVLLWESHLEPHEKDRELPVRLRREYAGVLAFMVRGAIDWMNNGFVEPESVAEASSEYKEDSDPVTSFLRTCTAPEEGSSVQSSILHKVFCAWAKAAGEKEWTNKGLTQALKKRLKKKTSNGVHWLGIKLIRQASDFVDGEGNVKALSPDSAPGADGAARAPPLDDGAYPPL